MTPHALSEILLTCIHEGTIPRALDFVGKEDEGAWTAGVICLSGAGPVEPVNVRTSSGGAGKIARGIHRFEIETRPNRFE